MLGMGSEQAPEGHCALQEQRNLERFDELVRYLGERYFEKGYDPGFRFENWLMLTGMLVKLEEAGIMPIVDNPNPFDTSAEELEQHEQWWKDHPVEAEEFARNCEKRNEILRYLYIGALLGRRLF